MSRNEKNYDETSFLHIVVSCNKFENITLLVAAFVFPFSSFSGTFEECSVRAIFALNQEKVVDDYLVSQGEANEEEIEEKYFDNSRRVVSFYFRYSCPITPFVLTLHR
jgi:hypothetical protein